MEEWAGKAHLEAVIDSKPKRFLLEGAALCRIGRGERNTIVLADSQVSRQHAIIQRGPIGEFYLTDLQSRNGTSINRRLITAPTILKSGDRIGIGPYEFVFHSGDELSQTRDMGPEPTVVDFNVCLITVLVADIRDFTGLSRRLGESKLSDILSTFMRDAGAALQRADAWAQKYIGDAVMAVWVHRNLAPNIHEMVTVLAGLARLFEIADGLQARFELDAPIRISAGVNTGMASLGNLGSDAAADHTAVSDAVNLAFRLESATRKVGCDLAVGQRTFALISRHDQVATLFDRRFVELKGYPEPTAIYTASQLSLKKLLDILPEQSQTNETQALPRG